MTPAVPAEVAGLRLAIVNWRDPRHPAAGGAERYAWELAHRFAAAGAHVRYVTGRVPGLRRRERVAGVAFVRMGGRFTIYPLVLLWMLARRRSFDAVLDCQNGIPFFTPLALPRRVPVLCAIFHVHDEQFGLYFPRWLARLGRWLEGPAARRVYRRHACTAISLTTVAALRERLSWTGPVYVVPVGVPTPAVPAARPAVEAARPPRLVCVSRLVPHKRVDRLLDLAEQLRGRWPGLRIDVIGRGPERGRLAAEAAARGLGGVITLHGFVPEEDKIALVAGADLHLSTSRGEGWGLSVAEAAALGVPSVAYDVDGLRDAVRDGVTGWLVHDGDDLASAALRALKELADPDRRAEVAAACRRWAGEFDWPRTAARLAALLAASVRAGSAAARHGDARVVRRYGGGHPEVLEGPPLDEALADPATIELRSATPLERLLGRVDHEGR